MKLRALVLMVVLGGVGCRRPLEPGETRCTAIPIGNGMTTMKCRTGQQPMQAPAPVAAPAGNGYWCATSATFGACFQLPVGCEKYRMIFIEGCAKEPERPCEQLSACFRQQVAACAPTGCFVDYPSCGAAEKSVGRDGTACAMRQ